MSVLKFSDYVHLHNHTQFSLLDGLSKIEPLIDLVESYDMRAIAKTDHGTLSGTVEFYKHAMSKDIKPIIGIETYVASRLHTDKDPAKDKPRFHLVLLAMNNVGYKNIMQLSSIANLEGFYYFPRIDHELLEQYNKGIIAMSGCMGGEVGQAIKNGQVKKAESIASWYKKIFNDRYYLEVQDHGHPKNPLYNADQELVNNEIIKIGKKLDIPIVVTCDAHYLRHQDQEAHEVLLCVGTGSYLSDTKRMTLKDFPLHVESPQEIINRWGDDYPDFITNTKKIADSCKVKLELGKILIPEFPIPDNKTEKEYLHELVYKGLINRYDKSHKEHSGIAINEAKSILPSSIVERAEYELGVIDSMGFNGYFLIIWDFVGWGKKQGIMFGPGRGSAAGSIIAYALNITDLDPIEHDLLFERFLNPDRISMPDIDIDIQDNRREEVIDYCVHKYGTDRVANIATYGRMAARAAVRDVARVLEVPYADADRMAKLVPPPIQGRQIPLKTSLKSSTDLKNEYNKNPQAKMVFDMAIQLEGTIRNHGVHAAGVVIAPSSIVEYSPLEMAQKGVVATQYPMGVVEELGLLKMDFLGLSNLTTIKNALRIIKKVYGDDIDINAVSLKDTKTYDLLSSGDTTGVFQLESAGMKRYLKELKPTEFNDIVAMCALYRPGPLKAGLVDMFVRRKNGLEEVSVPHEKFKNALSPTYGTLVYQEQVMQISKEVCGFTGGEADTLRKAIGKKIRSVMLKMQHKFIEGGVEHGGVPKDVMEKFWEDLMGFADYAFNKSHSACYALIAYWTAYLKAHYPAAFMAALMTGDYDDTDRLAIEIAECKHMGITVLQPDVNESFHEFSVVRDKDNKETIRFGLDAIKNVGHNAVAGIIESRTKEGPFKSLEDFMGRTDSRLVNKKVWESLIKTGALDRFANRATMLSNIDNIVATSAKIAKEKSAGQVDLFGGEIASVTISLDLSTDTLYTENDYLHWERELLGLYLSQHPLEIYLKMFKEQTAPLSEVVVDADGKKITVGGTIVEIRNITTKNGQSMAFMQLEDINGEVRELIIFPKVLDSLKEKLAKDTVLIVSGRISGRDKQGSDLQEAKVIVEKISLVSVKEALAYEPTGTTYISSKKIAKVKLVKPLDKPLPKKLYLRVEDTTNQDLLRNIKNIIDSFPGTVDTVLVVGDYKKPIKLPEGVNYTDDLLKKLEKVLPKQSIIYS